MRITIILICIISTSTLIAGPWPKNKGQGYFKFSEYFIVADQHYTDTGEIDPNVTNGFFSTYLYAEYGITDNLTSIVYFPFFSRSYFNNTVSGTTGEVLIPGEAINGIGDAEVSISYGLFRKNSFSSSIGITLGLPLGINDGGTQKNLQTGDGEFNQMIKLELGSSYSLGSLNGWISSGIGYNNRSKGYSDEIIASLQIGIKLLNDKLIPNVRVESRQSRYNGDPNLTLNFTSIFSNNTEYVSITPEIAYLVTDRLGISMAIGMTLSGKVIFARPSYTVGVFYDMN